MRHKFVSGSSGPDLTHFPDGHDVALVNGWDRHETGREGKA